MKKLFSLVFILASLLMFSSCENNDISITQSEYKIYPNETVTISGFGDFSNVIWESENEFVATANKQTIYGELAGTTIIKSKDVDKPIRVTVIPKFNTYTEPCIDWGISKSQIKSKYGTPYAEESNSMLYKSNNSIAQYVMYLFENNKLTMSSIILKSSSSLSSVRNFLAERYVKADMNTYVRCSGKKSNKIMDLLVVIEEYNSISNSPTIIYSPYDKKIEIINKLNVSTKDNSIKF